MANISEQKRNLVKQKRNLVDLLYQLEWKVRVSENIILLKKYDDYCKRFSSGELTLVLEKEITETISLAS